LEGLFLKKGKKREGKEEQREEGKKGD